MLTHWTNLIKTDCKVVRIGNDYVYPIFKCGCTTLFVNADQILVNEELQNLPIIKVILRDPEERFIAGVNKYCDDNNVAIEDVVKQIKKERVADEHFVPQWVWLFHLYRFYKGNVSILPMSQLDKFVKQSWQMDVNFKFPRLRKNFPEEWEEALGKRHGKARNIMETKKPVPIIKDFVSNDKEIIKNFMNKEIDLKTIVKDYRHVLS